MSVCHDLWPPHFHQQRTHQQHTELPSRRSPSPSQPNKVNRKPSPHSPLLSKRKSVRRSSPQQRSHWCARVHPARRQALHHRASLPLRSCRLTPLPPLNTTSPLQVHSAPCLLDNTFALFDVTYTLYLCLTLSQMCMKMFLFILFYVFSFV